MTQPAGRLKVLVLVFGMLAGLGVTAAGAAPPRSLDVASDINEVLVLPQNWSEDEARWFYNVPQGSKLAPFKWFLNLEQPDSEKLFRDADHIRKLGYLPRTPDTRGNPNGLPIGFVEDGVHLGITCAACHTSQINLGRKGWLIDGGPALGDFEMLLRKLVDSLSATLNDAKKFDRFATRVLGVGANDEAKEKLKAELKIERDRRHAYNQRNLSQATATPFGPGRVDAFGAILNETAVTFAGVPTNSAPADAPVSYPCLWDTPQHDILQWNGASENRKTDNRLLKKAVGTEHIGALGRNAGEVLGVFGTLDAKEEGSILELKGYPSSINRANLIAIEESLRKLWSPVWPAQLPAIQPDLRDKGESLYRANCQSCHEIIQRDDPARRVAAKMAVVSTDPVMATNFINRTAKTGYLKGRLIDILAVNPRSFGGDAPVGMMLSHFVQRSILQPDPEVLKAIKNKDPQVGQFLIDLQKNIDYKIVGAPKGMAHDGLLGRFEFQHAVVAPPAVQVAYKGRPLNGIWATAPYLHNGSIPNLDELLKPATKRSQAVFKIGDREFDPEKVGFVTNRGVEFDPTKRGNSNAGHDYGKHTTGPKEGQEFTDVERRQLLEYLKSL